jgi:hypothetical protein
MFRILEATDMDLPLIHSMQNIPVRERYLNRPLPALNDFLNAASQQLWNGSEKYFLLQQNDRMEGFIWISPEAETCEIWGKHLHSLFYGCARIAFENLSMRKLVWSVREKNRRMMKVCERFRIRKTGSEEICVIEPKFEFIAIGTIHYFEFKAEEYPERIPLMHQFSVQHGNLF